VWFLFPNLTKNGVGLYNQRTLYAGNWLHGSEELRSRPAASLDKPLMGAAFCRVEGQREDMTLVTRAMIPIGRKPGGPPLQNPGLQREAIAIRALVLVSFTSYLSYLQVSPMVETR
jgi:hypothetical protein